MSVPPVAASPYPAQPPQPPQLPRQVYAVALPYWRRRPRRGVLIAALVVAVVLLVGSVGATAAFVHDHATAGISRVVGPNGRTFVVPGPGRDGRTYQLPQNPKRQAMPMGPGRHYAPGQKSPTPSPSPSAG